MKKLLLILCLLLVTGCGNNEEEDGVVEFDTKYEEAYYGAIDHFTKLLTYEYNMTVENHTSSGSTATVTNVKMNRTGGFAALQDKVSKTKTSGQAGYTETPLQTQPYYIDYQYGRFVYYNTGCSRWQYDKVTLTDDSEYGPYLQILALVPTEKITRFENDTYYLETDSSAVADAFTNSLDEYSGNIKLEVKLEENGKFKSGTITLAEYQGVQKTISFEFVAYANVEVYMDQNAAGAKQYIGMGC